jgi:hypothetical protein
LRDRNKRRTLPARVVAMSDNSTLSGMLPIAVTKLPVGSS